MNLETVHKTATILDLMWRAYCAGEREPMKLNADAALLHYPNADVRALAQAFFAELGDARGALPGWRWEPEGQCWYRHANGAACLVTGGAGEGWGYAIYEGFTADEDIPAHMLPDEAKGGVCDCALMGMIRGNDQLDRYVIPTPKEST